MQDVEKLQGQKWSIVIDTLFYGDPFFTAATGKLTMDLNGFNKILVA